jgi:Ca2+-binding RTX toxin-like protein
MSASDVNQLLLETAFDNPKIITELGETAKMLSLGNAADAANSIHNNKKFKLGQGCQGRKYFAESNPQPIRSVTNGFLNGTLRDDVIKPQGREKPITIFSLDGDDKIDLRTIGSAAGPSYISGGKGSDEIICSKGVDRLIYTGTEESTLDDADIIVNFGVEDQIDLSAILKGDSRRPKFIGTDHYKIFTENEPGSPQIRATERLVGIDNNGDGISELRLFFEKPLDFSIDRSNFIL